MLITSPCTPALSTSPASAQISRGVIVAAKNATAEAEAKVTASVARAWAAQVRERNVTSALSTHGDM